MLVLAAKNALNALLHPFYRQESATISQTHAAIRTKIGAE